MSIHQMQIRPDEQEDRLLLRLSTTDGSEFRFWLTRSFVKKLWPMLVKMVEWDKAVRQQFDAATRQTVLELQHQGFAQQGDFSKGFEEMPRKFPLGEAPVLLATGKGVRRDDGLYVLSLYPPQGQGLDMTLDTRLLHIFGKLVQDAVTRVDWDMNLALGEKAAEPPPAEATAPRKLN
jgi:hypothetical protein